MEIEDLPANSYSVLEKPSFSRCLYDWTKFDTFYIQIFFF